MLGICSLRRWAAVMVAAMSLTGLPFAANLASGPAKNAPAANLTMDDILRQVDRGAKEFQSLTADIERTKVTVVVNDHSTESGQIRLRRDSKMRIDLTQPDPRTILRIGDKIYIYNPKIRRVEEYSL